MPEQDELAQFIDRQNDKDWWLKITDILNNKQVKLSKGDLELIQRIRSGKFADTTIDPFDFAIEFDNDKEFQQPLSGSGYEPKSRFQPSKWERLKINKFV